MIRLVIALFLLTLIGCDQKPDLNRVPPAPENLMTEEEFTQVMVDVEILEATLKLKLIRKPDLKDRILVYYDQIFEKNGITEKQFRDNLDFYTNQAVRIAVVYDSVQVRLSRMKKELEILTDSTDVQESPKRKLKHSE